MKAERAVSLAIAVSCVLAVGVSATTLDATLSTDPDDVINVDWAELPVDGGVAGSIEREMQRRQGGERETRERSSRDAAARNDAASGAPERQSQQQDASRTGSQLREPSPWARLLAMLRSGLTWLITLGFLTVGSTLGYRYRARVRGLLARAFRGSDRGGRDRGEESDPVAVDPATEIDRIWGAVVRSLDVESPETTTVSGVVRRAIDRGHDPDAVRDLADVFAAVRYGERPLTGERRRRARESYRALDLTDPPLDPSAYADGGDRDDESGDANATGGGESE
jgi:hypothetical protein